MHLATSPASNELHPCIIANKKIFALKNGLWVIRRTAATIDGPHQESFYKEKNPFSLELLVIATFLALHERQRLRPAACGRYGIRRKPHFPLLLPLPLLQNSFRINLQVRITWVDKHSEYTQITAEAETALLLCNMWTLREHCAITLICTRALLVVSFSSVHYLILTCMCLCCSWERSEKIRRIFDGLKWLLDLVGSVRYYVEKLWFSARLIFWPEGIDWLVYAIRSVKQRIAPAPPVHKSSSSLVSSLFFFYSNCVVVCWSALPLHAKTFLLSKSEKQSSTKAVWAQGTTPS